MFTLSNINCSKLIFGTVKTMKTLLRLEKTYLILNNIIDIAGLPITDISCDKKVVTIIKFDILGV